MAKQHSIPFRLYKRGETYHAYISYVASNGQRYNTRISTKQILPEKATQFCLEYIKEIENSIKLKYGKNEVEISFEQASILFFENVGKFHQNAKGTLEKLKQLKPFFDKPISEIDNQDLLNYVSHFRNLGRKPSTINRNLNVLSSLLNFCKSQNYNVSNVKIAQYKQREPDENIKYFENIEVVEKIISRASPHLKPIIYTALYTGMRKSNILGLKWENIDFTSNTINIKVKDRTKIGGRNLSIPMIPKLKAILENQPKINEYVFNHKEHPIHQISSAWKTIFFKRKPNKAHSKILKDPELPYQVFNTLRHTSATWILRETGNLRIVQQILGHKNIKTTLKYAHVLDAEKRQALIDVFK